MSASLEDVLLVWCGGIVQNNERGAQSWWGDRLAYETRYPH
jgi:hypothetical protein